MNLADLGRSYIESPTVRQNPSGWTYSEFTLNQYPVLKQKILDEILSFFKVAYPNSLTLSEEHAHVLVQGFGYKGWNLGVG